MIAVERHHDISCGHRIYQHDSSCAHLHGHNYRIHFRVCRVSKELDRLGRVLDFGMMKQKLCQWLEEHWDHKFLLWEADPWLAPLQAIDKKGVVALTFNPTAENMAHYLLSSVGPKLLDGSELKLTAVRVEETAKCSAEACLDSIS